LAWKSGTHTVCTICEKWQWDSKRSSFCGWCGTPYLLAVSFDGSVWPSPSEAVAACRKPKTKQQQPVQSAALVVDTEVQDLLSRLGSKLGLNITPSLLASDANLKPRLDASSGNTTSKAYKAFKVAKTEYARTCKAFDKVSSQIDELKEQLDICTAQDAQVQGQPSKFAGKSPFVDGSVAPHDEYDDERLNLFFQQNMQKAAEARAEAERLQSQAVQLEQLVAASGSKRPLELDGSTSDTSMCNAKDDEINNNLDDNIAAADAIMQQSQAIAWSIGR
jgi:hypothetical protein